MKRQLKTLYRCTYGVWGLDSPVKRYFETLEEAKKFWEDHDFCDYPVACNFTPEHAEKVLMRQSEEDYYWSH